MPSSSMRVAFVCLAAAIVNLAAGASPPATEKQPVTDTYFGVKVSDPYRWLEDNASAKGVEWNEAQNAYARAYLDALPVRETLKTRLTTMIKATSPEFSRLAPAGERIFAIYNDPQFQQPMLVTLATDASPASRKTVLDPNSLDQSGLTAIDWYVPSHDGKRVAVSLSKGGSEDGTLHVYDTAGAAEVGEAIPRVQYPTAGGSLAWAADGNGFWYTRYPGDEKPEADRHFYMQVYFHTLGQDWREDALVLGTPDGVPRIGEIFLDNRYAPDVVLASVADGDGGEWAHWLLGADGSKSRITNFKDKIVAATVAPDHSLYLVSRQGAPNGKVLRLAPGVTDLARATTIVAEGKGSIITADVNTPRTATLTRDTLLLSYIVGGPNEVRAFGLDGKPRGRLPLPAIAAFSNIEALPDGDVLFGVSTYLRPRYYARWHAADGKIAETQLAVQSPVKFDDAEVVREFATSKDGTKVPLNVIRRKGIELDGRNPVLLYGYGGYGVSQQPRFAGPTTRLLLDGGGVYVDANIRGGGEFGERWHEEGRLTRKQNVFDDFAAAGEYLVRTKYTDHAHLSLLGGSNGGLLMGAMITQHPQLARAVVSSVGIYDMLRVELDPNGSFNTTEFGTVRNEAQFKALYAYSPYHHVRQGEKYPAVLMMTGANDGRVNPMQSRKFTAALQAATASGLPVYLRISTRSGHGIGSSLDERIAQTSDWMAFLFDQLGMKLE
ncbi:MAG TPA: prolyl oligopeptidase family serine peptidase [Rudaea sp.]|nr:prolyl oligopeptidase family serine peptidase [Rudaea sp.]